LGLHREVAFTVWGELHARGVVLQRAGDPLAVDQELHGAFRPLSVLRRGHGGANVHRLTGANWAGLIRAQLDRRAGDRIDRDRSAGRARRECAAWRRGELRGDLLLAWVRAGRQLSGGDTIVDPRRHRRITKAEADGALSTLRHGGLDLYARTSRGIFGNLDVQGSVLACDRHRGGGSGWLELARILRLEVGRDLVLARDGEGQLSGGYAINHWSAGLQGTGGELYGALGCGLEASAQGCGLIGDRSAGRLEAQGHLGGVLNGDARQLGGPGIQRCASASAGRALHRGPDG